MINLLVGGDVHHTVAGVDARLAVARVVAALVTSGDATASLVKGVHGVLGDLSPSHPSFDEVSVLQGEFTLFLGLYDDCKAHLDAVSSDSLFHERGTEIRARLGNALESAAAGARSASQIDGAEGDADSDDGPADAMRECFAHEPWQC